MALTREFEELSAWVCPGCGSSNDHTNPLRCWNCLKKKVKLSTFKRLMTRKKKYEVHQLEQKRKEIVEKIEHLEIKETTKSVTYDVKQVKTEN
jgi:hypothetical protein